MMTLKRRIFSTILKLWGGALLATGAAVVAGVTFPAPAPPILYQTGDGYYTDIHLLDPFRGVSFNLTPHPARDTTPTWEPDGEHISFASDREGIMNLYRLDLDTRSISMLLDTTGVSRSEVTWSPAGAYAAFLEGSGTYVDVMLRRPDGTITPLTQEGIVSSGPVWSPDGEQVAFVNAHQNIPDVFVVGVEERIPRRLTRNAMASSPVWLADGSQLAYSVRSERDWRLVYVVDVETGEKRKVFEGADTWLLSWSPDTRHIAYIAGTGEARDLHLADFDPDPAREQDFDTQAYSEGLVINALSWSPDSEWIAFTARPTVNQQTQKATESLHGRLSLLLHGAPPRDLQEEEIYIYRLGWDAPQRVTFNAQQEAGPSWQPR